MFYAIHHVTRYRYSRPVWQSIMEVRMHPRTEQTQRCFTFQLSVNPRARIFSFTDHLGNHVHHFDLPAHHRTLTVVAEVIREREDARPRVDRQLKREAPLRLIRAWVHAHFHDALPHRAAVAIAGDMSDGVEHRQFPSSKDKGRRHSQFPTPKATSNPITE